MKLSETSNPYVHVKDSPSQETKESIWTRDLNLGEAWRWKDKQQFFYLMGTLLDSGLGHLDSLVILKDQFSKRSIKQLLERLHLQLEEGVTFSAILTKEDRFFNPFDIQTIKMGEETAQLAHMQMELGAYYGRRVQLRRKLSQALTYPIAVILVASLVLLFMLNFVVPMFEDIFKRFDADLPPITQNILGISAFLNSYGGWLFLGVAILWSIIFILRKNETINSIGANIVSRIPFFGPLIIKLHLARMSYSLGLLLTAKVNLDQALQSTYDLVPFQPIKKALAQVHKEVIKGKSLFDAMGEHPIFPAYILQMVKVGERTAKLDTLLSKTANQLEEESQATIGQLTQFLEPVLIIVLGGMVALILVSMYLPMFELGNVVIK
ncbi:MAG: type II secretion system F family protein [Bacteroidota bacterium]